jgi:hypothetical protein
MARSIWRRADCTRICGLSGCLSGQGAKIVRTFLWLGCGLAALWLAVTGGGSATKSGTMPSLGPGSAIVTSDGSIEVSGVTQSRRKSRVNAGRGIDVKCELMPRQAEDDIALGQIVEVRLPDTEQPMIGRLIYIGTVADPKTRRVPVLVWVRNPDPGLRSGVAVWVRFPPVASAYTN